MLIMRMMISNLMVRGQGRVDIIVWETHIATKLGLQSQSGTVVMKPSRFINKFSERDENSRGNPNAPKGKADVVLNRTPTRSTRISIPTIMIPGAVRAPWR